jgi:hypothetical protein
MIGIDMRRLLVLPTALDAIEEEYGVMNNLGVVD